VVKLYPRKPASQLRRCDEAGRPPSDDGNFQVTLIGNLWDLPLRTRLSSQRLQCHGPP
jgi:hypothetical protein